MNGTETGKTNKYVVFDWDGTLHDTKKLYAEAVGRAYAFLKEYVDNASEDEQSKEVLKNCGFIQKTKEELSEMSLSKYLGMTARQMWDDFMPELDENLQAKAEKIVGDSMVELVYNHSASLYEGTIELLKQLKESGHKLMILSNCKIAYLKAHREIFGLDEWFMDYYPAQQYDFVPKEEILKMIMDKYPGDYFMIGDRYQDIYAGKVCGTKTIGCAYGFGTADELKDADYIAKSVKAIGTFI